ncbi:hypothetical protein DWU98_17030 [Dyella monticola]|uniref:DUF3341 domain-containing protein n=1 Tax=Dyella monticola TaxID=1927958 RepID=A0A370WUA3_9GAMM|nr:hypothetical protein [Dyella monticola]RDS79596.1 hypothetical protein DWU98_17030 [Dyella monticola]
MKASVYCMTHTLEQTEAIVADLKRAGFGRQDVSALLPDLRGTRDFAYEHDTKAPEGATAGGVAGLGAGAALGWLAGIGALAIPGMGSFIAAGPVMSALSGAALGTTAGGIAGALVGAGMPEFEARRFDGKIRQGGMLISVHVESANQRKAARGIFEQHHAEDITTGTEAHASTR